VNKTLVLATRNQGKVEELRQMLSEYNIEVKGLDAFADCPEVVEDGKTFKENAIKKAKTIADFVRLPALADDSGLEVDALNGRPGVYSARFAGENATDQENMNKLIEMMKSHPDSERSARFRCVLALAAPGKEIWTCEGACDGEIVPQPIGTNGFGYDPIFYLPSLGKTMAQLGPAEKNEISHRGQAVRQLKEHIHRLL
jgi:XTP/dITP diphosphohydrolase